LLLLMASFALHHYGRSLWLGAILLSRLRERRSIIRTLFAEAA
jgi:hypothetical protein